MTEPKRILVCAAHPDDTEIGCGGSLTKYRKAGASVLSLIFSDVNPMVDPADKLVSECTDSLLCLGVKFILMSYPMRRLSEYRQDILQKMFDLKHEFKPDMVFIPSPNDLHNDHYTVAREGMRAFKDVTVLGYELPWNTITFHAQAFVKLEPIHIMAKVQSLSRYKSQAMKPYFDKNFLYGWARTRGVQIGCELAEAFEVIRWVN